MANRILTRVTPSLDGSAASLGDNSRSLSIRIPSGEYATPFWLQTDAGLIRKVDALPYQDVIPAQTIRAHSTDPAGFTFAFYSDWRFHSGAPTNEPNVLRGSNAAGTEPLLWNTIQAVPPSPDIMHVVSGADVPAGCPTANCLRVRWKAEMETKNLRKIVAVPDYTNWWHRFYSFVASEWDQPNAAMNHPHNVDVGETSPPIQHAMWAIAPQVGLGTYIPRWTISDTCHSSGSGVRFFNPPPIALGAWYRFEFEHVVLNSSGEPQMRVYPYIYNAAGTLVYDADDYVLVGSGNPTLRQWYDGGAYLIRKGGATVTAAEAGHRFIFGNEDPSITGDPGTQRDYYFAAVAAALQKIDDRLAA